MKPGIFVFLLLGLVCGSNEYRVEFAVRSIYGITATLVHTGPEKSPDVLTPLRLNVTYESTEYARVRITEAASYRWEVPNVAIPRAAVTSNVAHYTVTLTENPFGLVIKRKQDNSTVFSLGSFRYNKFDILWENSVGSEFSVFGLGERVSDFKLNTGVYTLFARDFTRLYDNGKPPGKNMYSSQPIYLGMGLEGAAHGGFLLSSNAMDTYVNKSSVAFRPIGGIIDYFAFIGPRPLDVLQQYQSVVGYPALPPAWALGWHNSRWGYSDLTELSSVVEKYTAYGIPLDAQWVSRDYMHRNQVFTVDPVNFHPVLLKDFIDSLHKKGKKFVPVIDSAIANVNYTAYDTLLAMGNFIRSPHHPGPLHGQSWPGPVIYPDWLHPSSFEYWQQMLSDLQLLIEFDGIWVDMNEPTNFCSGECGYEPVINDLPFTPGVECLDQRTVDLAATHYGGGTEFDLHNLYGKMMGEVSAQFFNELGLRPFVMSRSSFPGHGRSAFKWLGINYAEWDWLRWSIAGVFNFQIFGVPLVGADICGYNGAATEELCARWYQLGALYPFSRLQNSFHSPEQYPWSFGPTLLQASNLAIRLKYSLMNYYYNGMFTVSLGGGAFFQPSFFEFPNDVNLVLTHNSDNFMLGPALLVHPCLTEGAVTVQAHFPSDKWYNWYTGAAARVPGSGVLTLDAPLRGYINLHLRAGHIVPKADNSVVALSVEELRNSNITLVIGVSPQGTAAGNIVFDDGKTVDTLKRGKYTLVTYYYSEGSTGNAALSVSLVARGYTRKTGEWPAISQFTIFGCRGPIQFVLDQNEERVDIGRGYDQYNGVCWVYLKGVAPDHPEVYSIQFSTW